MVTCFYVLKLRFVTQVLSGNVVYIPEDTEELIIPGDKQEINEFMDITTRNCRFQLQVSLPVVSMQLANKHVYEVLYNRINSDLLLWEPSAPKPKQPSFTRAVGGKSLLTFYVIYNLLTRNKNI